MSTVYRTTWWMIVQTQSGPRETGREMLPAEYASAKEAWQAGKAAGGPDCSIKVESSLDGGLPLHRVPSSRPTAELSARCTMAIHGQ